ncbi:hypothetical protein AND_005291 [Anopheles darlingi]|uniref:C2H2-type domain-containing protein n=1 Tax=Anopheles darlingi TaxID=43151 RepID=W5JJD0_ANODA|nr:hypothetical protein AND_005291 [Anopheles darlingi]
MAREERNAAFRQIAEEKIELIGKQSSTLCSNSRDNFQKLMDLFSNNPRIKSDNIIKAIKRLTKLEAEVSIKAEIQVAEKQVHSVVVRQNIMSPQLAEPSGCNSGMRDNHSQVSTAHVTNHQSNLTTYSKPQTVQDTVTQEIFQMASSYHPQPIESSLINEERLSSKYPRKKKNPEVALTHSSSAFKTPAIPEKRGDDKLYFRRAEVFPAPAATYAEHRMRQANKMGQTNRQITSELHQKSPSPSQNNIGQDSQHLLKNYNELGSSTQTNTTNTEARQNQISSDLLLGVKSNTTPSIPIPDHVNHGTTLTNNASQSLSKPVQHLSPSAASRDDVKKSTNVTENTLPSSSDNHVESSKNEISKVSPTKNKQNKVNREVHSLIIGEIEFTESMKRREENEKLRNISNRMECIKDRSKNEKWVKDLLTKYGMQNETRVVLTRLEDINGIALRSRTKSVENRECSYNESSNTTKQNQNSPSTNKHITTRRKTVDCREALENPSQTNKKREQAKNKKIKCRRKSHCAAANSVTVSPEKAVQNSFYLSDSEDNVSQDFTNYEPPTKKQAMNKPKSNSNRGVTKTTSPKSKNKTVGCSMTRKKSVAKTLVSPQENSVIDEHVNIPNDNPDIHCQSNFMSSCSLCSYRGEKIIEHYLLKHKQNEVFVSRISPRQSDIIRKCPIPLRDSEKNISKNELAPLARFCCFCEKNRVLTYKEWIEHIAKHTGEYEFDQEVKTLKNPFVEIKFQNNNILAYICDRCNFVQTRLSAMENHLKKQHFSQEDGSAKPSEYIRFAVCRVKVESSSVDKKTNLELKSESIFGCQVVNNPIDRDEETAISDGMDHEILQELERLHGYEPLVDSIVKEEIDLNADAEYIHQCGKKGSKPTGTVSQNSRSTNLSNDINPDCTTEQRVPALQTILNENVVEAAEETRGRHANELTGGRDDPMDYDSDDSLSTIAMDDPEYQHSMDDIKEEEFAEECRTSDRDNPLRCDKNVDQNQDINAVPSQNESFMIGNGNGSRKNIQNIINMSCVKVELQEAPHDMNEENNFYNESNETRNESITDSPAKQISYSVARSNNGGSFKPAEIQENRPSATTVDGNVDGVMVELTGSNSDPFEIVRNEEQLQYLCHYSTNCKFVGSNTISLEKHVQTKHVVRWSGYCHTCKGYIENHTGFTKKFPIHYLKHFLLKHSDPKPDSQVRKPLTIRFRRLSGDKLSVVNN